jgi:hypothetical protein
VRGAPLRIEKGFFSGVPGRGLNRFGRSPPFLGGKVMGQPLREIAQSVTPSHLPLAQRNLSDRLLGYGTFVRNGIRHGVDGNCWTSLTSKNWVAEVFGVGWKS